MDSQLNTTIPVEISLFNLVMQSVDCVGLWSLQFKIEMEIKRALLSQNEGSFNPAYSFKYDCGKPKSRVQSWE